MAHAGIGEEVQGQWGHCPAISKKGIPDKVFPWQGSKMMEAAAQKSTKALCAFKTQLGIFIEKELCEGSLEAKEWK